MNDREVKTGANRIEEGYRTGVIFGLRWRIYLDSLLTVVYTFPNPYPRGLSITITLLYGLFLCEGGRYLCEQVGGVARQSRIR